MRDYIEGALYGCAIGDALGMPYEGQAPQHWSGTYENSHSRFTKGLARGHYTDDTQLTLATLQSICELREINIADMAARFARLHATKQLRGSGRATQRALKRVIRDETPTGEPDAHGCGSAMRTGMLAFLPCDGRELERIIIDVTRITHDSPVAIAASMAMTYATAYTRAQARPLATAQDKHKYIDHVHEVAHYDCPPEFDFPARVLLLHDMTDVDTPQAAQAIGNGAIATESVILALHAHMTHPDNFEACMRASIESGGDTDSIASMAGTLYGSRHGIANIPNTYKINVEGAHQLRNLAARYTAFIEDNR